MCNFKPYKDNKKLTYADWSVVAATVRIFVAIGELNNCLPGTEANFITKSRSLELLPCRFPFVEYEAWICTAVDCFKVRPPIHKRNPFAWAY